MKKTTGPKKRKKSVNKILMILAFILILTTPALIIYTSACLASSNIEVERLKKQIEDQENVNAGLSMQLDELASLSTIQDIAKSYGLSYNNDNIIVIK